MKLQILSLAAVAAFALPLRADVSVEVFYDSLDPLGEWIEVDSYGYCWQPRGVVETWQPYTVGEWAYTDAGWTWISEEPHGWATYHYGRWARISGRGWVWVPDTVWAPAWVSWRHSEEHTGWAPLPPESRLAVGVSLGGWVDGYFDIGPTYYNFVPTRHLGAPHLATVILPRERNVTIIRETRNVTNIRVVNNVVINNGPDYDTVSRRAERPIRKLRLERNEALAGDDGARRTRIEGDVVKVSAPRITAQAAGQAAVKPRRVAQKVAAGEIDRGWKDAGADAQPLREKIRAEAKVPADLPPRATAQERTGRADRPGAETRTDTTTETAPPADPSRRSATGAKPPTDTRRPTGTVDAPDRDKPNQPTTSPAAPATPAPATPAPKDADRPSRATPAPGATPDPLRRREPQPDLPERDPTRPPSGRPDATTNRPAPGEARPVPPATPVAKPNRPDASTERQEPIGERRPERPAAPAENQPNRADRPDRPAAPAESRPERREAPSEGQAPDRKGNAESREARPEGQGNDRKGNTERPDQRREGQGEGGKAKSEGEGGKAKGEGEGGKGKGEGNPREERKPLA